MSEKLEKEKKKKDRKKRKKQRKERKKKIKKERETSSKFFFRLDFFKKINYDLTKIKQKENTLQTDRQQTLLEVLNVFFIFSGKE